MSGTYMILYRHMKIETSGPAPEIYDCWIDGKANTATIQRMDEHGPIGEVETVPLDEDGGIARFAEATYTIIESIPGENV